MVLNCEYYRDGMCVYIPRNLPVAVYEKCWVDELRVPNKQEIADNCVCKRAIRTIKQRDLELVVNST